MEEEQRRCRVCVTGATGNMGSLLVKKLLEKGHVVHATVRNPEDDSKVGFLWNLAGASARLSLFSADLYAAHTFEPAIRGCEFVFLVATPLQHIPSSQFEDIAEATMSSVRTILQLCERSRTVRRVIFTGSVTASSAMKEDGSGFKEAMDESCWTPLHLPFRHCQDFEKDYTRSKTLSEKELLSYNERQQTAMEVVSLTSGLFGGDTILSHLPLAPQMVVSPMTGNPEPHRQLKFLHALLGSVPLVHIDDVCEAHAFCMEPPSMAGRFLCAAGYPALQQIADYYADKFPDQLPGITKEEDELEAAKVHVPGNSTKLTDLGFNYKHTVEQILDDSFESAKRFGVLDKTAGDRY